MMTHTGDKPLSCSKCDLKFMKKCNLKRHEMTSEVCNSGTITKPYPCTTCDKRFIDKHSLKCHEVAIHLLLNGNEQTCPICGKAFMKNSSLIDHLHIHTDEKPYACEQCSESFRNPAALQMHKFTHNEERQFACKKCDQKFIEKRSLIKHDPDTCLRKPTTRTRTRWSKIGGKPFRVCTFPGCEMTFTTTGHFKEHLQRHSTERPYPCTICERAFKLKRELKYHLIKHSKDNNFVCTFCDLKFAKSSTLEKHLRSSTACMYYDIYTRHVRRSCAKK